MGRSSNECKKIGIQMAHGQVFHSAFIPSVKQWSMVFLPLAMMTNEQLEEFQSRGYVHLFAPMSSAGPRSINGMPMFMECAGLTEEENSQVLDAYNAEVDRMRELED